MGLRVAVRHRTTYRYDRKITLGPQVIRLRPAPHCRSHVLSYSLQAVPEEHFINWQQDPWGNHLARLVFPEKTDRLELDVDLVADLTIVNPFDFFLEPEAEIFPFEYSDDLRRHLAPYLETQKWGKRFKDYLASIDTSRQKSIDFVVAMNRQLQQHLDYSIRLEHGLYTPEETLEKGVGSCRDFAWLQVQLLRHVGLAARFVSGYSVQLVADEKPLEGPAGVLQDIVDLHAWGEVFLPGAGWIGLDPTSGLLAGEGHIPLACAPDPEAAAPIGGEIEECDTQFDVSMSVTRLREAPRTTKPFEEDQWNAILACGDAVEERMVSEDVRLTMGGEPTFVSIDDFTGEEWTVAAVGPNKRKRAEELLQRLRKRFAPGGVLHYGEGKWYPGESLPRWSLNCYWRTDGEPLWRDQKNIADPFAEGTSGPKEAERFAAKLAERLGVNVDHVLPAFEDTAYYLWREGRLPINVDPLDNHVDDPEERDRLARIFERGLGTPTGWVLPIERSKKTGKIWQSGLWMLRAKQLFLSPGDSPLGLRLPLPNLPWAPESERDSIVPLDPTAPRPPFPRAAMGRQAFLSTPQAEVRHQSVRQQQPAQTGAAPKPGDTVRTAVCVEPRQGRLHVFLPPVVKCDDYVELVQAIEDVAEALDIPIVLEGYMPPEDHRLKCIKVTPDPGVIEVNVHPVSSWREQVELTTGLYEDARASRLGPEKFLVDGRRVGTGGGNHVVFGAATPLDSPFLRRPHLVSSLVSYWNNHPSLSYLFSGLFIGPTSQHPRTDEARHDQLYELEIAIERAGTSEDVAPWLVDRVFRDLLVDATGNTHRTEFCIDKLYSPDSATGRLGLLELRAFEMPPHPRMAVAQQLLLRALIARFWSQPYRAPLVRWGTQLHDRFMLPHWVREDLQDVLHETKQAGFDLQWAWFAPQFEFRFPRIGSIECDGVELELRNALEPWHVLGEDGVPGGTVRYVDSSLDRLQVRVSGLVSDRHAVTCNGRRVPLHPTGRRGEFVAAVRFRTWQPERCLHPTIEAHAPLVFDLVDTWSQLAIAGCKVHVGHPGGRNYEEPPINSYEAEARRRALFEVIGHTPGTIRVEDVRPNMDAPFTLDLRR